MLPPAHKLYSLDSLRAVLCLIVLIDHMWEIFIYPITGDSVFFYLVFLARCAVLCFFCLSGYVISLTIHANKHRLGSFSIKEYYLARLFRIVPPLLLILLFSALAQGILTEMGATVLPHYRPLATVFETNTVSQLLALFTLCIKGDITGGDVNPQLWTLQYEIQLYVVAGLIGYLLYSSRTLYKIITCLIIITYLYEIRFLIDSFYNLQTLSFAAFGLGALVYTQRNRTRLWVPLFFLTLLFLLAYILLTSPPEGFANINESHSAILFQMVLAGQFSLLIVTLARKTKKTMLHNVGGYSYTLYIVHCPLLLFIYFSIYHFSSHVLETVYGASMIAIGSIVLALIISACIGPFIEQPHKQRNWLLKKPILATE